MTKGPDEDSRKAVREIVRDLAATQVSESQLIEVQAEVQRAFGGAELDLAGQAASLRVARYDVPLPPPDMLQAYEGHRQGLSKKLVDDWEAERSHRREQSRLASERNHELEKERLSNDRIRIWLRHAPAALALVVLGVVACLAPPTTTAIVAASEALSAGVWAIIKRKPARGHDEQGVSEP